MSERRPPPDPPGASRGDPAPGTLTSLLDEVFRNLALCVHDLKMLVLLLESFKDVQYLEVFVMYLHRVQPKLASLVFNWVFLENFVAKFDAIVGELFGRLYAFEFHAFENFSLMLDAKLIRPID